MIIHFNLINDAAHSYPKPKLPVQPVVNVSSLTIIPNNNSRSSVFFKEGVFLSNARTCLAQAFTLSGVDAESAVLLPAYHCGSMVEPVLWLNAEVLLYHLEPNLAPKQQHLETLIANATRPIRAMLLPHYFGFPQDIDHWRAFCDLNNIILIEDCAHAFFGTTYQGEALGARGDYAVASVRKFFSGPDGGILIGQNLIANSLPLVRPKFKQELHAVLQTILLSAEYGKLGMLGKMLVRLDKWRSKFKKRLSNSNTPIERPSHQKQQLTACTNFAEEGGRELGRTMEAKEAKSTQWNWFDPTLIYTKGLAVSQILMNHSRVKQIIDSRRRNYIRLVEGISGIQNIKPIFPDLPSHVVPYMVPIMLESGEADFDRLKRAGVPIWRWEELAESDCEVSQRYRLQLLHIPCHQELGASEIDWICSKLTEILGKNKS